MNTLFLLMAEFESATVDLETVAQKYLGMDKRAAYRDAAASSLPFPAFRCGSQKSPWMVHVSDLAEWIDSEREKAKKDWKNMH